MRKIAIAVGALVLTMAIGFAVGGLLLGAFSSDSKSESGPLANGSSSRYAVAYFFQNGHLVPLQRPIDLTHASDTLPAVMNAIGGGLTPPELRAGFSTASPGEFSYQSRTKDGVVEMKGVDTSNKRWLAQLVFTLTRLPSVRAVSFEGGSPMKRSDFERLMPAVLVESPVAGSAVRSPLHVTGTANTFEATFEYDLRTKAGKLLAHHFVTATSGTGQRGTFAFDVRFHVKRPTPAKLIVYESSAGSGKRINVRAIPLTLRP